MRVLVPAMLLVALLATACSGHSATATLTPSPAATTATAAPTATPAAPAATATATATATAAPAATATATATRPAPPTTTRPAPPPTATSTPPATAAGQLIEHGSRSSKEVALTFDMGGRVDPALDIMGWLVDHRVPATIFMTGAMADNKYTDAGRQVLQMVASHSELFDLGNHSYSHPDFRTLTTADMRDELSRTEASIAKYVPLSPRPFFRPPFGGQDAQVVETVAAAGYPDVILWDVDTIDWMAESDGGPTTDDIVAKVTAKAQAGSIILMHLGGYNTFAALPRVVDALRTKGLQPVTLGQMLGQ